MSASRTQSVLTLVERVLEGFHGGIGGQKVLLRSHVAGLLSSV